MKRKLIFGLLIFGACAVLFLVWDAVGGGNILRANQLPNVAYRAIASDASLTLYSLDPNSVQPPDPRAGFHGFPILGQTIVADASLRSRLAETLRQGIATWRFTYASCFLPRHGLRATLAGQTYDVVICFACSEVRYYPPDGSESGYHGLGEGIKPGPFADILATAKVSTAKPFSEQ
jgi:hypothetical protein